MYNVLVTDSAKTDLRDAANYIATILFNLTAANDFLDDADILIDSLEAMPARFPLIDDVELSELGLRKALLKNYLVFFIIREEQKVVSVQRILYGRRDWEGILKTDLNALYRTE
jgi:plasmid stabilization system protein ParE